MRIVLTGSSGRVGRAIYSELVPHHHVIGIDRTPFSTTSVVSDFVSEALLKKTFEGVDAVIHTAALHAPHVGLIDDSEFFRINVEGTRLVIGAAVKAGVRRIVFTSTTAIFGKTIINGAASWVTDETSPSPRTIYHTSKLQAEELLRQVANESMIVRVIRMSRCFPESADVMALLRLSRGIDVRDVAKAHVAALTNKGKVYECYIVSGTTPFLREDCIGLATNPEDVVRRRAPKLWEAFQERGWQFPSLVDRVYVSSYAEKCLSWKPVYGFEEVLAQLDRRSLEVLPVFQSNSQTEE